MRHHLDTSFELKDGILILRPLRPEDAPVLATAVRESLIELHPWMDWATEAFDEAAANRWLQIVQLAWEHSSAFHFAITDAKTGQYIGNCGIDAVDQNAHRGNLGYWVRTSRTRHGIAPRAALLAARFAFEKLDLERLEIVMATKNQASQFVARKTGAQFGGFRPQGLVVRTHVYDAILYTLGAADIDPQG